MTWWGWLLWVAGMATAQALLMRWFRRRFVARSLREGRVQVSVRLLPACAQGSGRWGVYRAQLLGSQIELQRWNVHPSQQGIAVLSLDPSARAVRRRERLRLVQDATEAVMAHTSAGPVEIAGSPVAIGWLRGQLAAAPTPS
jgi:hypothetical protein